MSSFLKFAAIVFYIVHRKASSAGKVTLPLFFLALRMLPYLQIIPQNNRQESSHNYSELNVSELDFTRNLLSYNELFIHIILDETMKNISKIHQDL